MIPIDLFHVPLSQSNGEGRGAKSQSPAVPTGKVLRYYPGSSIADANDPICPGTQTLAGDHANGGSMWPSFGLAYHRATGRHVGIVLSPVGGSSITAASDIGAGNWDTPAANAAAGKSSTLIANSMVTMDAAITAFTNAGFTPVHRGVFAAGSESDGLGIQNGLITPAVYKTALANAMATFRAHYSATLPLYLIRLGDIPDQPASRAGFDAIRYAQEEFILTDPYSKVVWREGAFASAHGLYGAGSHYNQAGLNRAGEKIAQAIVSGDFDRKPSSYPGDDTLYYEEGDLFTTNGATVTNPLNGFKLGNSHLFANIPVNGYLTVYDWWSNSALLIGAELDRTTYYRNTHHKIQNLAGSTTFKTFE